MTDTPDTLRAPDAAYIDALFTEYWRTLVALAELLDRGELIIAEERVSHLRACVLGMMLAANGIERPTNNNLLLNRYLGESQRTALEKTLATHGSARESIIGRAVALSIIYQWYAPQLAEKYGVAEPRAKVEYALHQLAQSVPEWPTIIETA